jgi:hypothetical protein
MEVVSDGNLVPMHSSVEYLFSTLNFCILPAEPHVFKVHE